MEGEVTLKIHLNLQKLAMISVATSLWQSTEMKNEIRKLFPKDDSPSQYKICYIAARKALQNKNSITLPAAVSTNLDEVIIFVGENLFDWIYYITVVLGLPFSYAKQIYWTCNGIIDKRKIYQIWLRMGMPNLNHNFYFKSSTNYAYVLASIYADDRFLNNFIPEMTQEIYKIFPTVIIENYRDKIYTFMCLWLYFNFGNQTPIMNRLSFFRTDHIIPPECMFLLCVNQKLIHAAEYFFNKLNVNDQQHCALDRAKMMCLDNCKLGIEEIGNKLLYYKSKQSFKILMFLIKNMNDEQRNDFIVKYHPDILQAGLHHWLFPELFMSFFNFNWPNDPGEFEMKVYSYSSLLNSIVSHIQEDIEADCPVKKPIFNVLLNRVWEKIPNNMKLPVVRCSEFERNGFVSKIFDIFDLDFIRLMLNNPYLSSEVLSLLNYALNKCRLLMSDDEYLPVALFMTEALPQNRLSFFLKETQLLEKLIMLGKFDVAEQILDMLSNNHSSKSRLDFKREINGVTLCCRLMQYQKIDLVNKYINWQFDLEEDRQNFKTTLKSNSNAICHSYL